MNYFANLVGDWLVDEPVRADRPVAAIGGEDVIILTGDREAVVVLVAAADELDAERRIIASFGDCVTIEDIGPSSDQQPYAIAECGCIAFGDDTGSPCPEHDPS